jgi:hypothetical protein
MAFTGSFIGVIFVSLKGPDEGSADFERLEEIQNPIVGAFSIKQRYVIGILLSAFLSVILSV